MVQISGQMEKCPLGGHRTFRNKVIKRESALAKWKEIEFSLTNKIHEYLLDKYEEQGGFVSEDFEDIPTSILSDIKLYEILRDNFFKTKQAVLNAFPKFTQKG